MHELIWLAGQSNCNGFEEDVPADIPAIRFYRRGMPAGEFAFSDASPTTLQSTSGASTPHHGLELQMGKDLVANGLAVGDISIIKTGYGGTFITEWLQGAGGINQYERYLRALRGGRPPVSAFRCHFVFYQGENEALNANAALAAAWDENFATLIGGVNSLLGVTALAYLVQVHASLADEENLTALRASQATAATAANAPLINVDDLSMVIDGVHLDGPSQNTLGSRVAAAILARL